jgi:predicted acyltransferase
VNQPDPAVTAPLSTPPAIRLGSIDAYRGFVMLLMMGEVLHFCSVSQAFPASGFWKLLCHHQSHVDWVGCVLHDLIQPSFSFLVGAALPFSIANRLARGQSKPVMFGHAVWRALLLVLMGVWLRSTGSRQTNWTFEDTLSQIGLGYTFLFVLGWYSVRAQWAAFIAIVVGYWAAFALYPLPGPDFDYANVGVSAEFLREHGHTGFAAHWQKNSNLAWAFDTWWLNLFSREKPWTHNGGGYATLSFIPTLGTMVLGLIAGGVLKGDRTPMQKTRWLVVAGVIGLAAGLLLNALGICPNVKRIWTPSWVLFSGGWCCVLLAGFYAVIDVAGFKRWSFPLLVVGMNSIAAYCIAHLWEGFIYKGLRTHFGADTFKFLGAGYEPLVLGATVLLVMWLVLFWMYRRKIFLRI